MCVQASSLIFLVIIAIWAAYFLQYWVRRREHLATARAVDRFSESMRLLELRSPAVEAVPASVSPRPAPRSYVVSPARSGDSRQRGRDARAAEAAVSSGPGLFQRALHPGRRVRGLTFLASLVALTAVSALAARAVVPLWAVAVPAGLILVTFVWMRVGVRAAAAARGEGAATGREQRSDHSRRSGGYGSPVREGRSVRVRRTDGRSVRPAERRQARRRAMEPAAGGRHAGGRSAGASAARGAGGESSSLATHHRGPVEFERSEDEIEAQPVVEPVQVPAAREELFDIEATADPLSPPPPLPPQPAPIRYALVDEDDIPLTWDPVPVPRPTYTMKSRALRVDAEPSAAPRARFEPEAGTPAYALEPERRVAGI